VVKFRDSNAIGVLNAACLRCLVLLFHIPLRINAQRGVRKVGLRQFYDFMDDPFLGVYFWAVLFLLISRYDVARRKRTFFGDFQFDQRRNSRRAT